MRKGRVVLITIISLFYPFVFAQEKKEEEPQRKTEAVRLEEVVVTATRSEKEVFELPYTAELLDFDYLTHRKQARTIPEALQEMPGVMVQKTGHGQGSPFIRGFTGFRNLLLIDGIRLNNSVFREGPNQYWATVDPLIVERMEIVKGPASVLYGSDAIGGTVNLITREREDYTKDKGINGRGYYRFATAERSHIGRLELEGNLGSKLGFLVGGNLKDYGDVTAGRQTGRLPKTAYDQQNVDFKMNLVYPNSKLTFAYQYDNINDAWRTHRTIYSKSWRGTTVGTDLELSLDQKRQLMYLQYEIDKANTFFDKAKFNLSLHSQDEKQFRRRGNSKRTIDGFNVDTLGLWGQFISPTKIGKLTYGWEYYLDFVDSFRKDPDETDVTKRVSPRGSVADNAKYHLFGLYLQDEIEILKDLELTAGMRYSWMKATAGQVGTGPIEAAFATLPDLSERFNSIVGNARLLYHINENWNVYGGIAQGFRAPNLSDLTRFDISRSGEQETPSTSVKPEKYITFETGIKTNYETLQGSISYFYTMIDGMIVRVPTGNKIGGSSEVTKRNAGDGFVHGVETSGALNLKVIGFPQWTGTLAFSWLNGEVDTFPTSTPIKKRKPLGFLPPITTILGLKWEHPSQKYWAEGLINIVNDQDRLSPGDQRDTQRIPPGGTPGYTTYTIRGGASLSENAKIFAAIENITDKNYRVFASGQNEPGRNFIMGFDLNF